MLPGFPWFQADSNFTTPALGDVYGNGRTDIVEGGDSSAGSAYGTTYTTAATSACSAPPATPASANPAAASCASTTPTRPCSPRRPSVSPRRRGVGHRLRHRRHLQRRLAPPTTSSSRRRPLQRPAGSRSSTAPPPAAPPWPTCSATASSRWSRAPGWDRADRSGPSTGPPGATDLAHGHGRAGHRLGRHRRSHRRRVPGRHRAHHGRARRSSTASPAHWWPRSARARARPSRTRRWSPTTPTGPSASPSPATTRATRASSSTTRWTGRNGATVNESGAWPMFHHDPQLTGNAGLPSPVVQVPVQRAVGQSRWATT